MATQFTDNNFEEEVLQAQELVMVDFYADWCGPCKMMAPVIDALEDEYSGKAKIGKLNVDSDGQAPKQYNVTAIPTILFFKGGKIVDKAVGACSKTDLVNQIEKNL